MEGLHSFRAEIVKIFTFPSMKYIHFVIAEGNYSSRISVGK